MSLDFVRILSPHLDDAVLSCGGAIAAWARTGVRVEVLTPFAADEPEELPASELVQMLHRVFGLESGVVAARRSEDEEAVRSLGAEPVHEAFVEGIYRVDGEGHPLYPDLKSLFGTVRGEDRDLEVELSRWLGSLPAADLWLAPLGVGGHVDHQLVREASMSAAEEGGFRLELYEDVPYVMKWRALNRVLRRKSKWRSRSVEVDADALDAKIRAVAGYRSQVGPLFGSERRMARKLRQFHRRRAGAERLWTPAQFWTPAGRTRHEG